MAGQVAVVPQLTEQSDSLSPIPGSGEVHAFVARFRKAKGRYRAGPVKRCDSDSRGSHGRRIRGNGPNPRDFPPQMWSVQPVNETAAGNGQAAIRVPDVSATALFSTVSSAAIVQAQIGSFPAHQVGSEPTNLMGPPSFVTGTGATVVPDFESGPHSPSDFSALSRPDLFSTFVNPVPDAYQSWDPPAVRYGVPVTHGSLCPIYAQSLYPRYLDQAQLLTGPTCADGVSSFPNQPGSLSQPLGLNQTMSSPDESDSSFEDLLPYTSSLPTLGFSHIPDANDLTSEMEWTVLEYDKVDDDWYQHGLENSLTASSSPSKTTTASSSTTNESYQFVPWYSDELREIPDDTVVPSESSRSTSVSTQTNLDTRKGGRTTALGQEARERASNNRRLMACVRCQMQRISCMPTSVGQEKDSGDCGSCIKVARDSKKVIHHLPCKRWRLNATVLFRGGQLEFTRRPGWQGTAVKNLGTEDWADQQTLTIKIKLGLCPEPVSLQVRKFISLTGDRGDVLNRCWTYNKQKFETDLPPYALKDVHKDKIKLRDHILDDQNAFAAVQQFSQSSDVHELVRRTFVAAWQHMLNVDYISGKDGKPKGQVDLKVLMSEVFYLWFAMRNTLGSAELVGQETLGIEPDNREGFPLGRHFRSVPRLICQQLHAINYNTALVPYRRQVLTKLDVLMKGYDPSCFYTVYLAIFVLLHGASAASKDSYWHAWQAQTGERYHLPTFIEQVQEGANIMLMHWRYYKRDFNPLDKDKPKKDKKKQPIYSAITAQELRLMRDLADISQSGKDLESEAEKRGWNGLQDDPEFRSKTSQLKWERDLHFVSQMFQPDWQPEKTWVRGMAT